MLFPELETPAVLVDHATLLRNIQSMAKGAQAAGVQLRPHIKTHKTAEILRLQLEHGATGVTVAKLGEAEVMASAGANDLLVAYQITGEQKCSRIKRLQDQGVRITCGADNREQIEWLDRMAGTMATTFELAVEVNTGLDRAGVLPGEEAVRLAHAIATAPNLRFRGFFTHEGHAYSADSPERVAGIGTRASQALVATARDAIQAGLPVEMVSVGSTPTARAGAWAPGVTEIRPGNYVFHDRQQIALGAAAEHDCALTILATVISRPAPDRAVIDAGSKTLSSDRGAHGSQMEGFGNVQGPFPRRLIRLSEEHGVLAVSPDDPLRPGDRVRMIPNHACVVSNLHDWLFVVEGNRVTAQWRVAARGRVQ
jgi:D-serine deaminase-like pyridoxal phosphate-dependent protein